MSYVLIKFKKDYADEFSVYGIRIMTTKEWTDYLKEARNASYPNEMYFGSNEYFQFDTYQDVVDSFKAELLSSKESITMRVILGDEFGWFPEFEGY